MLDPYRMIVINIICSLILFIAVFIYRYIYPKRKINLLVLLILISFLPLISILRKGTYESGDLSSHTQIAMGFYDNLIVGNIIPRWGADFCGGYGCPDYQYLYQFPYYIVSFFHFLSFSFINSIKILLISSFIASGMGAYLWIKEELKNKTAAFAGAILYLFAPYHLVNMHFRVDIAEMVTFALLPFNFLITKRLIERKTNKLFFLQSIFIMLLIISHQPVALASFPFIIFYALFIWYRIKDHNLRLLLNYFLSILLGVFLSSFYWMPILFEKEYIFWGLNSAVSFPKFYEYLYSTWRYGFLFQGPKGELSFLIGYIQLFLVLFAIFLLLKGKIKKSLKPKLIASLLCFFFVFLFIQSFSKPLWDIIPLVKNFQFATRLIVLLSLFISLIGAILAVQTKSKIFIFLICFFAIFPTILNWGNRRVIPEIGDSYLRNELKTIYPGNGDLTTPKWVKLKENWNRNRTNNLEVIKGKADIIELSRNSTRHEYLINANTDISIKENTFYYPGWIIRDNERILSLDFDNTKYKGVINFDLKKGLHKVEVVFTDTQVRVISLWISILSLILLLLYTVPISFRRSKSSKIKYS